jgi:hypothetical protein
MKDILILLRNLSIVAVIVFLGWFFFVSIRKQYEAWILNELRPIIRSEINRAQYDYFTIKPIRKPERIIPPINKVSDSIKR